MENSPFEKEDKRMKGLRLASRYSCVCEHARLYRIARNLKLFATNGSAEEKIIQMLSMLDSKDYYDEIGQKNDIGDPFDIRIVSYYWRGVPKLKGDLWHNFTVLLPIIKLHISHIQPEMVDDCLVHWAKVVEVNGSKINVEYHPMEVKDNKLIVGDKHIRKDVESLMTHMPKVGDLVTIHFSTAVESLEPRDANILLSITRRSLKKFNSLRESNAHYR